MGSVVLLFLFAALALFLLGCKEGIILLKKRNRICKTTGRIVDVSTLAAETMKVYNSKWALVMYSGRAHDNFPKSDRSADVKQRR